MENTKKLLMCGLNNSSEKGKTNPGYLQTHKASPVRIYYWSDKSGEVRASGDSVSDVSNLLCRHQYNQYTATIQTQKKETPVSYCKAVAKDTTGGGFTQGREMSK